MNNTEENKDGIIKLEVTLAYINYPKDVKFIESGEYGIFSANVQKVIEGEYTNSTIKLKGNVCKINYGCSYKVYCILDSIHPKYGASYNIVYINRVADISTKEKQHEFLSQIITNSALDRLFEKYDDVIELLETEDMEKLTSVVGIGVSSAERMIELYNDSKDYSDIYIELGALNLTPNLIKKMCDHYKSPEAVIKKVRENPYELVEMDGMGFKRCDEIALKVGIDRFDVNRIGGYIKYYLREQGELGRTWVLYSELMSNIYEVLGYVPEEVLGATAQMLMNSGILKVSDDGQRISHRYYYDLERNIFKELIRLNSANMLTKEELEKEKEKYLKKLDFISDINDEKYIPNVYKLSNEELEKVIKETELEQGFEFNKEQLEAIKLSNTTNVIAVTGYGGTGKSSTARGMCKLLKGASVTGCALAGKAALRITETTGLDASTIHKALGWRFGSFTFNKDNQLDSDVVLIDESTMINGKLFYALLQAIPTGSKVIMLGDIHQITPIGSCQVFSDILNTNVIKSVQLVDIHRQAKSSGIVPTSIQISQQKQLFDSKYRGTYVTGELNDMEITITDKGTILSNVVCDLFKREYDKYKNILDVQVCCLMKNRGDVCCYNLNNKIQEIYNPKNSFNKDEEEIEVKVSTNIKDNKVYKLRIGDKVINTKNNYNVVDTDDKPCVIYNGSIGIIKDIRMGGKKCIVNFEGIGEVVLYKKDIGALELAYAITIHKSQGSEYPSVITVIDDSSYIMNNSEVLYTGITRAKKHCTLLGTNSAIRHCITQKETKNKQTYLKEFLDDYYLQTTK